MIGMPIIVTVASPTAVRTDSQTVREIRWVGATTAGHQCVIQNPDGDVLWDSVAAGANYVEADIVLREWPNGFAVVTLGSGHLHIYTDRNKAQ